MKKILCVTATLAFLGCGSQNEAQHEDSRLQSAADSELSPRVINGTIPKAGAYESVALLVSEANVSFNGAPAARRQLSICTSTLISPTAILSAAHCVNETLLKTGIERATGADGKPLKAKVIGPISFRVAFVRSISELNARPEALLEVARVEGHAEFAAIARPLAAFERNPGRWDDISIVYLKNRVTGRRIQKLVSAEQMKSEVNDTTTRRQFAGFGLSVEADPTSAGILMEGSSRLGEVGTNEFIAGVNDEQVACRGDSGGPIYLDNSEDFQIGIASRVNKQIGLGDIIGGITGTLKVPSCELGLVYTRVDTYLDWIKKRVPDLGQSAD